MNRPDFALNRHYLILKGNSKSGKKEKKSPKRAQLK